MSLSLLNKLQGINNTNFVSVYVPSVNKNVDFKELTVKQQKNLLSVGLQGNKSGVLLQNTINDIIKSNITESIVCDIYDRIPIIIALKLASLGKKAYVSDINNVEQPELIDISSMSTKQIVLPEKTCTLNYKDSIFIEMCVPTIDRELQINADYVNKMQNNNDLAAAVSELYMYSIIKHLKSLTIEGEVVELSSLPVQTTYKFVESLPATINQEIIEFIQKFNKAEEEYLTIDNKRVIFDARLFSVE